jgi:hypothetical protein
MFNLYHEFEFEGVLRNIKGTSMQCNKAHYARVILVGFVDYYLRTWNYS